MIRIANKVVALAAAAATLVVISIEPAVAGANEAQMNSFWTSAPKDALESSGAIPDNARAYYQGDMSTSTRQSGHRYLDCTARAGDHYSCKPM